MRIVEAIESTRKHLESTPPKDHEDHTAEKGVQFVESQQFGAQVCSNASNDENSGAKAVDR